MRSFCVLPPSFSHSDLTCAASHSSLLSVARHFLCALSSAPRRTVEVSKSGFLQLLKSEGAAVTAATASTSLPTPATMGVKIKKEAAPAAAAASAPGWKVLQDDYLMGGKMSDWDKAVHSSEEEEEAEEDE